MEVSVIGISHRTAPVEVREKFALPGELARELLRAIHAENIFSEVLVLDTCNRTEVYFVPSDAPDPMAYLLGRVARVKSAAAEVDAGALYRHEGPEAVEHLFRVAAALDSQIVGEYQILGQVKDAYRTALEERTARFVLNKLLHRAFRVGKRAQTETDLGRGSVSVASTAVDMAGRIFSDLTGKTALLVGAGKTAESAARGLIASGVRHVIVANRTLSRAQGLAETLTRSPGDPPAKDPLPEGRRPDTTAPPTTEAIELHEIPQAVGRTDLVLCSTGSPDMVLRYEDLAERIRRSRRPLFIVDIAVPRDVDPALDRLSNVYLYNLDHLDSLVAQNLASRRREIPRAEAIVKDELEQFVRWFRSLEVAPTIKLLQEHFQTLRSAEIERYGKKFADADGDQLDQFTRGLCNKILHRPIAFLRQVSDDAPISDRLAAVDMVLRMFGLDSREDGP